jgi:proline iminopeptidase
MNWQRISKICLASLFGLTVLTITAGLIWRSSQQRQTEAARTQIDPKFGVNELFKAKIGGIDQWLHVRGVNRADPVILYLHGGPGFPMMPFESLFQDSMEKQFIVVNWDQRCTGKTYFENPVDDCPKTAHYDRMMADAIDVVDLLKKRYGKKRLIILGHSWGSMLGLGVIKARPNDVAAYVGVGQVVDMTVAEAAGYQTVLAEARKRGNKIAISELEALAPYPDKDMKTTIAKLEVQRKWISAFGIGISWKQPGDEVNVLLPAGLRSPEYSLHDISFFLNNPVDVMPQLLAPLTTFKASKFGADYEVPMILMLGRHDWQVPSTVAAAWLETINAPSKKLVWFENSAHAPMFDEPEAFAKALVDTVKPFAIEQSVMPTQIVK